MSNQTEILLIIAGVLCLFVIALTDPVFFNFFFGWMA
jgi:hypothetical protein